MDGVVGMSWQTAGSPEAGPFRENDLKICDLCGALNLAANRECFVCGWRGRFERRRHVVRVAMDDVERAYGKLALEDLTDVSRLGGVGVLALGGRLGQALRTLWRWLFA